MNNIMLKTITPTEIKCNQITDLTLLIMSLSGFVFGISSSIIYDPLLGSGYIGTGLFAGVSLYTIKKMRLRETIANSVSSLSEENDELKENNEDLKENNNKLEENLNKLNENNIRLNTDISILKNNLTEMKNTNIKFKNNLIELNGSNSKLKNNLIELNNTKSELDKDLIVLKSTVGLIGDNSDELFNKLKNVHCKLELENDKHSLLIKSQTSLLLMNIINHYDKNSNFILDDKEITYAKNTILNILPGVTWKQLENKINNNELKLESILELI